MFDRPLTCLSDPGAIALPLRAWRPADLEAGLAAMDAAAAAYSRAVGFEAKAGQLVLLPGEAGLSGALLGLGEDRTPWAHGSLALSLPEGTCWMLVPGDYDMEGAILGFCLGSYQFERFKRAGRRPAQLSGVPSPSPVLSAARATWLVRDLINTPANVLGPAELAGATADLGRRFGVTATLTEGDALALAYPTVHAVGWGSDRSAVVAQFEWRGSAAGPDAPLVSLCGKGVCFDTGGYDLKPSAAMLRMKKDMGGAALMLGLAAMVMEADLPVRLAVRIGCVENMVSGRAMRPLDVVRTRAGHQVEIGNTDAEGRLVLCDLLAEACEGAPALLIDAATLTGAARVALGPDLPALFCPDDALAERVQRASAALHDPVWRLPLCAGYDPWLASSVADFNTVAGRPMAGAIVAALFLQRFVTAGTRWLHIDTYAWNDTNRPGRPEGGEALGLRALFAAVSGLAGVHEETEHD